jgi:lipoprotein-releasing system ATP-binding protein
MADINYIKIENHDEGQTQALLAVRGLCKSFKYNREKIEILKELDFDLNIKDAVSIIGASGIGKSTFLHILGALEFPDSGTLKFKGEDIFSFDEVKLAKFRNESLGFIFQFHHLLPDFTALENVMMPALIRGIQRQTAEEIAYKILVRVGLKDRSNHRIGELSGGEQQRTAIARALVLNPSILLADEPTGNLDKKNSEVFHELLMELNYERNMALIVVTHNPELASKTSRKMTIFDGKLVDIK